MNFKVSVQKVKEAHSIVDYIIGNGVELAKSGNQWKGLCPFHNEKTPSFIVDEDFQSYKCFGCGAQGDIIEFAKETHTLSFSEALKMLAEEKGIEVEQSKVENEHDISAIREVVKDASEFYRELYLKLDDTHPAKKEISKRGLDINNGLFGYASEAPNALYKYLVSKGHSNENIEASNLVIMKEGRDPWDFFHGRLMITLSDYLGRPISFTSRKLYDDDKMQGKYVNGRDSVIFHKKTNLFGADRAKNAARKTGELYVVEGQFDQIAMYEKGIENVVATSGTAFTPEHANLILRMVGENGRVVFIMDGDKAGVKAALSIFKEAPVLHTNAFAVHLENGEDPCDYIQRDINELHKAIEDAKPLHDFVITAIINELGEAIDINNRNNFVAEVAKYAKHAENKYIRNTMLDKASIMSAIVIDRVREIYEKTEVRKANSARRENKESTVVEEVKDDEEKDKLEKKIIIDKNNSGDSFMYSALAMLVRRPDILLDATPDYINKKFSSFFEEVRNVYTGKENNSQKWRFIEENHSDMEFAKELKKKRFLGDDLLEEMLGDEGLVAHYKFMVEKANEFYIMEHREIEKAKSFSSISNETDPVKISEALESRGKGLQEDILAKVR